MSGALHLFPGPARRLALRPGEVAEVKLRLQVTGEQMTLVFEKREEVMAALKPLFGTVLLDLEQRSPSVSVKGGR